MERRLGHSVFSRSPQQSSRTVTSRDTLFYRGAFFFGITDIERKRSDKGRTMTCTEGREPSGLAMENLSRVLGDVRRYPNKAYANRTVVHHVRNAWRLCPWRVSRGRS